MASKTVVREAQMTVQPWEVVEPCQAAPAEQVYHTVIDVGVGSGALAATPLFVFPDNGLEYEIDEIFFAVTDEALDDDGGTAATLAVGLQAANGTEASGGVAVSADVDYFIGAAGAGSALTDTALYGVLSTRDSSLSWATTADTATERRIIGPAFLICTMTAGSGGSQTGKGRLGVRYHVSGSGKIKKYALVDEAADA